MAKLFCLACALAVIGPLENSSAQTSRWRLEVQTFRDHFDRHSGFDTAWGGGLSARCTLADLPFAFQGGIELSRAGQQFRFVEGTVETHTRFVALSAALTAGVPLFEQTTASIRLIIRVAHLQPQAIEIDTGVFGTQRFAPRAEYKIVPGLGIGVEQALTQSLAINLRFSRHFLKMRVSQLFADEKDTRFESIWRLQAGLAYAL